MNLNGLKKLLRDERTELVVKIYDENTNTELSQMSVNDLLDTRTKYDRCQVEWFCMCFDQYKEYTNQEEMIEGFFLSLGVNTQKESDNETVTILDMDAICDNDYGTYHNSMAPDLVEAAHCIDMFPADISDRITQRMRDYRQLPVDKIGIRLDAYTIFWLWIECNGDVDKIVDDDVFIDAMRIDLIPVLPDGDFLFRL